jgi:putative colanic acid biosynthesis acetyltransferase WcaF
VAPAHAFGFVSVKRKSHSLPTFVCKEGQHGEIAGPDDKTMRAPTSVHDPYLRASTTLGNRAARALWIVVCALLFRPTPRPLHAWRAMLLRVFGAQLGQDCWIYPGAIIWAPWNLVCEDAVRVGNGANIYNVAVVTLRSHSIVSQEAYLCSASHDINDPAFPMVWAPITLGRYAWVCARASVCPGVRLGDGAVLALGAVATKDLDAWTVYGGVPAQRIATRRAHHGR